MKVLKAWGMSLSMFSILPVPAIWDEDARPLVVPLLPGVGLVFGCILAALATALQRSPLNPFLQMALFLSVMQALTGFIHLDGLMDTADALFSRAAPEKRLQILKDPHAGSFAVITLLLVFLLQGASVCTILQQPACWPGWLLIPLLSRACVSVLILLAPDILTDGLARQFREKTRPGYVLIPAALAGGGLLFALLSGRPAAWLPAFAVPLAAAALFVWLYRFFRGLSGDLAGFILVGSETIALSVWAVALEVIPQWFL